VRAIVLAALALLLVGCGTAHTVTQKVVTRTTYRVATSAPSLDVGVVGNLTVNVPGAKAHHGTLAKLSGDPLVLVAADTSAAARLASVAAANPHTHYALVGGSAANLKLRNVVGLVIRGEAAAQLAGAVAGLVAQGEGVSAPRVGLVGPANTPVSFSFGLGVHAVTPHALVLHAWTSDAPAACKEAALTMLARGAVAVAAAGGRCADAAVSGAHEQNAVAIRISDFELLSVPAAEIVRDAVGGVFHGGEDLVFGPSSGAIGIGRLDPRISQANVLRARTLAGRLASGQSLAG
jgi:basic membrane lipoprotein Med (substrate-binding protein (PBP1-ABC) superfamily)